MRGRTSKLIINLSVEQKSLLESWLRRQNISAALAKRARGILGLSNGQTFVQTSTQIGIGERHLRKWAKRFMEQGIDGLYDLNRPGRVPVFSPSSGSVSGEDRL